MFVPHSEGPTLSRQEIDALAAHGRRIFGWRLVDRVTPAWSWIRLTFTVLPEKGETRQAFEQRMDALALMLSRSGYPVEHRYIEENAPRMWSGFACRTPQYRLPEPEPTTA